MIGRPFSLSTEIVVPAYAYVKCVLLRTQFEEIADFIASGHEGTGTWQGVEKLALTEKPDGPVRVVDCPSDFQKAIPGLNVGR